MPAQRLAASRAKAAECVTTLASRDQMLGAKVRVEKLEHRQLGRGDRGVIDKLAFSQPRKRGLELGRAYELHGVLALDKIGNRLDVQIKNIDEQPARGAVGTRMRRGRRGT